MINNDFWDKLNSDTEENVKRKLSEGAYGQEKNAIVNLWLKSKEDQRKSSLEDRNLDLALEANDLARKANRIAWIALIISILILVF